MAETRKTKNLIGRREAMLAAQLESVANRFTAFADVLSTRENGRELPEETVETIYRELHDLANLAFGAGEELASLASEISGSEDIVWPRDLNELVWVD